MLTFELSMGNKYQISLFQAGGPSNLLMDLAANEKAVHADFFNGVYKNYIDWIFYVLNVNTYSLASTTTPHIPTGTQDYVVTLLHCQIFLLDLWIKALMFLDL